MLWNVFLSFPEKYLKISRKPEGRIGSEGGRILSASPAKFRSAPWAEPKRGGGAEIEKVILYSKTDFKDF